MTYDKENEIYSGMNMLGPESEFSELDKETIIAFFDIADNESIEIGELVGDFELSGNELVYALQSCFDTSKTIKSQLVNITKISELASEHASNIAKISEHLSLKCDSDEHIDILSKIYTADYTTRAEMCGQFFIDNDECTSECQEVPFTLESIKEVIGRILEFDEDYDHDEETFDPSYDFYQFCKEGISDHVSHILDHLPEDSEYKKFDIMESLPKISLEIGKLAVASAIGATIAIAVMR